MRCETLKAAELTDDMIQKWAMIQQADSQLHSPYFRPEFTQTVAAVRDDVYVCVIEDNATPVGFFPFHRRRGGIGQPIGLGLSDYHGLIADAALQLDVKALLRSCGLVRYEFDHLLASQHAFRPHHLTTAQSPIAELAEGFEAFEASRDKAGRKQLREAVRKEKKLTDEVGELRFVVHSDDTTVLRQLMLWKSEQCRRTGTVDYFALPWCVELIERIHATQAEHFGGILSCLYAQDTLAAAHFVMRSKTVWHSWFPAYNHEFHAYSPGMILLLKMIQTAADEKVAYLDFGKGMSTYKSRFMTRSIKVAEGHAEVPSLRNFARSVRNGAEQWGRQSALNPLLRIPGRIVKRIERKRRYG